MPDAPKQLKVFLCHSSQDKQIVQEVYKKLNSEGWIDPWLDEKKILPGMDWNMEIEKAVEASHIVLVFLTNNSVNKEGYIQRELKQVLNVALDMAEGTIFVIPLRLDECQLPRSLRSWHWLNYFPPEEHTNAYERLLTSFRIRADKLGIATDVRKAVMDEQLAANEGIHEQNENIQELVKHPQENTEIQDQVSVENPTDTSLPNRWHVPLKASGRGIGSLRLYALGVGILFVAALAIAGINSFFQNMYAKDIPTNIPQELGFTLVVCMISNLT